MINKKYVHKVIGIPVVVTSLGVTVWLVNKWKLERLLNSELLQQAPTPEEPETPEPNTEPSEDTLPQEGSSTNQAQDVNQGSNEQNRGESGKAKASETQATEAEEEQSQTSDEKVESQEEESQTPDDKQSNEEEQRAETTVQENSETEKTSKDSEGSSKSEELKVELTEEIKKLINKLPQEAARWSLNITSLRNTFIAYELLGVGNKLLKAWEQKLAADKATAKQS